MQDGWDPAPPNDYAMCKLGVWDREIPRCVRPGCLDPVVSEGVRAVEEMDGAIVKFFCKDPSQILQPPGMHDLVSVEKISQDIRIVNHGSLLCTYPISDFTL